jgi:hypothetical protein
MQLRQLNADLRDLRKDVSGSFKSVEGIIGNLRVEVAEIRGKISSLPTKWTVWLAVFSITTGVIGILFAIVRFGVPSELWPVLIERLIAT